MPRLGEVLVESGAVAPEAVLSAVLDQSLGGDNRKLGEILVSKGVVKQAELDGALESQGEGRRSVADSSIRVDVDLLDALMTLVGELVLTRNQIVQHASTRADPGLVRSSQRLNLIASELQEGVMKTRMQPIDSIWSKVPRVVRDLSHTCGKQVRVEMEGKETELDRTILESTKDPLTHLVRNAVDHAIETPEERIAAGKHPEGTLLLRAYHEGGQVNIEITDDGKGIDPAVIGAKAIEKGLVSAEQLGRMTPREIVNLIFLAGFSTAAAVTNVSGRGVGMDVVKTNIEKIGGTIDVQSHVGRGTTFRIKIPLTLAIIPALTVTCAGDRYAIPQVSLLELVRLEGEAVTKGVEQIHGAPVYRLRGSLLPLVYLDRELAVGPGELDRNRDTLFIVVLQAEDRQFGLVVDDVIDTEEIVVKPLGKQLKGIPSFAGATILGDGTVALILDVLAVAQQSNVLVAGRDRGVGDRNARGDAAQSKVESLLVVGLGEGRRMGIPLAMVTRLEEFPVSTIERVGSHEVVQYRGQILPLVRLALLPRRRLATASRPTPCRSSSTARTTAASASSSSRSSTSPSRSSPPAATSRSTAWSARPSCRSTSPSCSTSARRSSPRTPTSTCRPPRPTSRRSDMAVTHQHARRRPGRRQPAVHDLHARRPPVRRRGRDGPGGHPLPGDHPRAARPRLHRRPDQPARPGHHRARPAAPARHARRGRRARSR